MPMKKSTSADENLPVPAKKSIPARKSSKKMTVKQLRYVACYDGNIVQSAKKANISYVYAKELHTKTYYSHVRAALKDREAVVRNKQTKKHIATREERQLFWTVMMATAEKDTDKLKASELLGRSQADFVDRHEHSGPDGSPLLQTLTDEERQRLAKILK